MGEVPGKKEGETSYFNFLFGEEEFKPSYSVLLPGIANALFIRVKY